MAILRLLGDFCHLTSILILIYKIHTRKTTAGISLRTRVLYLLVFLSRYGDLFLYYVSFYNTFMKILYLSTTAYIIYLMTINAEFKNTWYHDLDNFAILPLVIASFLLMFICTAKYTMFELSWTFSIILESVAILPQIDHLTKVPTLPALPLSHLVALGMYRGFYVLHWTVTLFSDGFWDFTVFFFGLIQTIIWADFLWVWYNRKQIKLPPNTAGQGIRSEEAGTAEGQQVDESDMSSSFVLTHLIRMARQFEARYRSSRSAPLSVSAYPERGFETQAPQSTGAYVDDLSSAQTASTNDDGAYTIPDPSIQPAKIEVPAVLLGEAEESTSNGAKIWGAQAPGSTTHGTAAQRNKSEDGFSVDSDHEEGSRPGEAAR